jgi:hypothetical protein
MTSPRPPELPAHVLRSAFHESGEKHFFLSCALYRSILGPDWRWAMLGFAYLKLVDNAVDKEGDSGRAKRVLDAQRALIRDVYAGRAEDRERPSPECYGYYFFCRDWQRGSQVRRFVEALLETFEFDIDRRSRFLSRRDFDDYAIKGGGAVVRALVHSLHEGVDIPTALLERASLAYVYADALIDLDEDLEVGLVNIPSEHIERFGIDLGKRDVALARWIEHRSVETEALFDEALAEGRRVASLAVKILVRIFLGRKRRRLRRFLRPGRQRRRFRSFLKRMGIRLARP